MVAIFFSLSRLIPLCWWPHSPLRQYRFCCYFARNKNTREMDGDGKNNSEAKYEHLNEFRGARVRAMIVWKDMSGFFVSGFSAVVAFTFISPFLLVFSLSRYKFILRKIYRGDSALDCIILSLHIPTHPLRFLAMSLLCIFGHYWNSFSDMHKILYPHQGGCSGRHHCLVLRSVQQTSSQNARV